MWKGVEGVQAPLRLSFQKELSLLCEICLLLCLLVVKRYAQGVMTP